MSSGILSFLLDLYLVNLQLTLPKLFSVFHSRTALYKARHMERNFDVFCFLCTNVFASLLGKHLISAGLCFRALTSDFGLIFHVYL